jgi:hypothetical protein
MSRASSMRRSTIAALVTMAISVISVIAVQKDRKILFAISSNRNGGMEKNLDLSPFHKKAAFGHELVGALNGYRNDGRLAGQSEKKASTPKFLEFSASTSRSFRKYQKRIPFFFHQPDGMINAPFTSADALSVYRNKTDKLHPQTYDGNSEYFFF